MVSLGNCKSLIHPSIPSLSHVPDSSSLHSSVSLLLPALSKFHRFSHFLHLPLPPLFIVVVPIMQSPLLSFSLSPSPSLTSCRGAHYAITASLIFSISLSLPYFLSWCLLRSLRFSHFLHLPLPPLLLVVVPITQSPRFPQPNQQWDERWFQSMLGIALSGWFDGRRYTPLCLHPRWPLVSVWDVAAFSCLVLWRQACTPVWLVWKQSHVAVYLSRKVVIVFVIISDILSPLERGLWPAER